MNQLFSPPPFTETAIQRRAQVFTILEEICQKLEWTQAQIEKARTGYEAVADWLAGSSDPMLASLHIYLHGSGALGTGQRMARSAPVEAGVAFHEQGSVLDPVGHEERAFDPTDFTQGEVQSVLLTARPRLAQDSGRFQRPVANAAREPHDIAPMLPDHLSVDLLSDGRRQGGPGFRTAKARQSPIGKVAQARSKRLSPPGPRQRRKIRLGPQDISA